MSAAGALQFARFAFPPNELGYCGPPGGRAMLDPDALGEIEARARQFEGAWVYLQVLAELLGTDDPLAAEVVEAYWIGTDLLDRVDPAELVGRLEGAFLGQAGGTWRDAATRASPHHSFQVFEVYPWAAMLRQGLAPGPAVNVLDRCRVRTGEVTGLEGEWVEVTCRPLAWDGARLEPSAPVTERARWSLDGLTLLDPPAVGATVALHWDWVCDVLGPHQVAQVEEREARQRLAVGLA